MRWIEFGRSESFLSFDLGWNSVSKARRKHIDVIRNDSIFNCYFLLYIVFGLSHTHTHTHSHRTSNVTFHIKWIIFTKDSIVFVIIYDSTVKWPSVCASGWCEVTRLCSHFNMWITILPMEHDVFILTKFDRSLSIRSIGQHFYTQSAFHIDIYMKWT